MEIIKEDNIKTWLAQASINNHHFKDLYKSAPPKVIEMESQLVVHEVAMRLLELMDYQTISKEARVWDDYISRPAGST